MSDNDNNNNLHSMDNSVIYYHTPTDKAVIKDFIQIVKRLNIASQETLKALMDDLHYVEDETYPDGKWTPSADLDKVWSSRFNRSDLLSLPKNNMETEIEVKTSPSNQEEKPDMKRQLVEKVVIMAEKLWAKPETIAMLKKDCGIDTTEEKPMQENKPKAGDDLMEMLKQMSNRW